MRTEQEIQEMLSSLTKIHSDEKHRASQMISVNELWVLEWVLGNHDNLYDVVFDMYKRKKVKT